MNFNQYQTFQEIFSENKLRFVKNVLYRYLEYKLHNNRAENPLNHHPNYNNPYKNIKNNNRNINFANKLIDLFLNGKIYDCGYNEYDLNIIYNDDYDNSNGNDSNDDGNEGIVNTDLQLFNPIEFREFFLSEVELYSLLNKEYRFTINEIDFIISEITENRMFQNTICYSVVKKFINNKYGDIVNFFKSERFIDYQFRIKVNRYIIDGDDINNIGYDEIIGIEPYGRYYEEDYISSKYGLETLYKGFMELFFNNVLLEQFLGREIDYIEYKIRFKRFGQVGKIEMVGFGICYINNKINEMNESSINNNLLEIIIKYSWEDISYG